MKLPLIIRRTIAYWQMRSIEITLAGMIDAFSLIDDPDTAAPMRLAMQGLSRDLAAARARYQACLPPGERRTWRLA
jgi:hypothetical protein